MKKARAYLDARALSYEFIDYTQEGIVARHIADWNQRVGWQTLLNTRGLMWKKLSDDERSAIDEIKALHLMQRYPVLIKRPVLDCGKRLIVGFNADVYSTILTP